MSSLIRSTTLMATMYDLRHGGASGIFCDMEILYRLAVLFWLLSLSVQVLRLARRLDPPDPWRHAAGPTNSPGQDGPDEDEA